MVNPPAVLAGFGLVPGITGHQPQQRERTGEMGSEVRLDGSLLAWCFHPDADLRLREGGQ